MMDVGPAGWTARLGGDLEGGASWFNSPDEQFFLKWVNGGYIVI